MRSVTFFTHIYIYQPLKCHHLVLRDKLQWTTKVISTRLCRLCSTAWTKMLVFWLSFIYVCSICVISLTSVHSFHRCGWLFHRTVHSQCDHIWKYHSRIVLEDTHFETERQASCHTQIHRHKHVRIHLCICSDCKSWTEWDYNFIHYFITTPSTLIILSLFQANTVLVMVKVSISHPLLVTPPPLLTPPSLTTQAPSSSNPTQVTVCWKWVISNQLAARWRMCMAII